MAESDRRIIDPPVSPFSTPVEIEQWITRLRRMRQSAQVRRHIKQAKAMLTQARQLEEARRGRGH